MAACMFGERCDAMPRVPNQPRGQLNARARIATWQASALRAAELGHWATHRTLNPHASTIP